MFIIEFPFTHFKYIVSLPLGLQSFAEKATDNLMGIPSFAICYFSLVGFNIFIFDSNFCQRDLYVSGHIPLWIYPAGNSVHFLNLSEHFHAHFGKLLAIISSNINGFLGPFSFPLHLKFSLYI